MYQWDDRIGMFVQVRGSGTERRWWYDVQAVQPAPVTQQAAHSPAEDVAALRAPNDFPLGTVQRVARRIMERTQRSFDELTPFCHDHGLLDALEQGIRSDPFLLGLRPFVSEPS